MNTFVVFLAVTSFNGVLTGISLNASKEFNELLLQYDKHLRPFTDEKPAAVKVQISLLNFGPINEKDFTFRVDMFMRQWWVDPRLKFSQGSISFNGNPKNMIWLPDLFIRNSRSVAMHSSITETIRTTVYHDGNVYMSARISAVCQCKMDLKRYPMDNQTCHMIFESYAYNGNEMSIQWHKIPLEYNVEHLQIEGYKLLAIHSSNSTLYYTTGEFFQLIQMSFEVQRTFLYYVYRSYLPSSFLVVMSWGSFYVPATSYPARCGLVVTNFLASAFVLQGASSQITKVPYATAIELYLLVNITFIVMVMLEYILVMQLSIRCLSNLCSFRNRNKHSKAEVLQMNGNTPPVGINNNIITNEPQVHEIDKLAMLLFPLVYFTFLVVYFVSYLRNNHG